MPRMTQRFTILTDRIDERLQAVGLTDRKASLDAVGKPDLIRNIRRGSEPGSTRLEALAARLGTTTDYLLGRTDVIAPPAAAPADGPTLPSFRDLPKDMPVFGTAIGAEVAYWSEHDGEVAIEQTDLNTGEVIDYYRRPPALRDRRDVYVLYVAGDSMSPAHEPGSAVMVDPRRSPSIQDYVVVYLRDRSDEFAAGVLIKRLVKRSGTFIELEQFNPPAVFRLETKQYRDMHRVIPWPEALGI
jgi:hypothetical protein